MAQQNSFDVVSQVDRAEITNAINQTLKEVVSISRAVAPASPWKKRIWY